MDAPVDADGDSTLYDLLGIDASQEDALVRAEIDALIATATEHLNGRDRALVEMLKDGATLEATAKAVGVPYATLHYKLARICADICAFVEAGGAAPTSALGDDRRKARSQVLTHEGLSLPLPDWSRKTGLPTRVIRKRLDTGWSVSDALTKPLDSKKRTHGAPELIRKAA